MVVHICCAVDSHYLLKESNTDFVATKDETFTRGFRVARESRDVD